VIVPLQRRRGIAIERRAHLIGKHGKADVLGMEDAAPIGEVMHGANSKDENKYWPAD
jgi:hypothetical protein